MIVFHGPQEVPADFGPSVVAIGKFDGVHAGHRAVLERARVDAASSGANVVAVTFDRNPLSLLRPEICPEPIVGVEQKLQLLSDSGIDATLLLTFDEALAAIPPRRFVTEMLLGPLGMQTVLVGQDFRFGTGGSGNPQTLQELGAEFGFRVDVVADVRAIDDERRVSSSWIRSLLDAGDVHGASALLGRPHAVRGEVVHGHKRGRELGYPTANLSSRSEGFVPADGVYAGWLVDTSGTSTTRYPAAISVGSNPTFGDVLQRQVEAYVLDHRDLDLYDHVVEIQFVERVRGMVAFPGIDALMAQMAADVDRVRDVLS